MNSLQTSLIHNALTKKYEERSPQEHKVLTTAIAPLFPILTPKKIKLLTFFLELREAPAEIFPQTYSNSSFIITFNTLANPEQAVTMQKLSKKPKIISAGEFVALLDYQKYLNADRLGQTSIEKELSFWEGSEYFCSMPKKKFLELIRLAKVLVFNENQCPYVQGQLVTEQQSGSGIYVVRSGEFGCYHKDEKEVEVSRFESGHLFGSLELIGNLGRGTPSRVTTVRCKTSSAIVYKFSYNIFNQYIRHYCENVINQRQGKLLKFIPKLQHLQKSKSLSNSQNLRESKIIRFPGTESSSLALNTKTTFKNKDLEDTQLRAFPLIRLEQIRQTATSSFYKSTLRESERIESEGLKKTNYLSLKKDGPLKNYPLPAQRSNFLTSQFRDLDKLFEKPQPKLANPCQLQMGKSQRGVWKRDMISSFYRQNIYSSIKRGSLAEE